MPKSKTQKVVFSVLMSLVMVYGMETYNRIVKNGFTPENFTLPIFELAALCAVVILLQEGIAGRLARTIAFKIFSPERNKLLAVIAIQISTVLIMCPMMSFVATLAFKHAMPGPIAFKWVQTLLVNLPFAFAWQLFVAGPLVRRVVKMVNA